MIAKKVAIALACLTRFDGINAEEDAGFFDADYEAQYDLTAFTNADGEQLGDENGLEQVQQVFNEAHACMGELLLKFDVKNEAMDLMAYVGTPDWIETAEFGSKE